MRRVTDLRLLSSEEREAALLLASERVRAAGLPPDTVLLRGTLYGVVDDQLFLGVTFSALLRPAGFREPVLEAVYVFASEEEMIGFAGRDGHRDYPEPADPLPLPEEEYRQRWRRLAKGE